MRWFMVLAAWWCCWSSGTAFAATLIHAGRLIDGRSDQPQQEMTIVIEPGYFPEIVRPKAAAIGPVIRETFKKAHAAGVKIAFGTDSGVSAHGDNSREFELMVEGGMPPMKAIQAATLEASRLLRIDDRLGTIEPQKLADIVAVKGNPLQDIKAMKDVVFVMKDGVVHKGP